MPECRALLRTQFDVAWSLAEHHLQRVSTASLLWEPATPCWTVRLDTAGRWRADWAVPDPDPAPPVTGAWVCWYLGWWWTVATAHLSAGAPPRREEVTWPGGAEATVAWLRGLRDAWVKYLEALAESSLGSPVGFPWPLEAGRTVGDLVAWVNLELMKNAAELGQVTMLHAAAAAPAST